MIDVNFETGCMSHSQRKTVFSDRPYLYSLQGRVGDSETISAQLTRRSITSQDGETIVTGLFSGLNVALRQRFRVYGEGIEETITFRNLNSVPVVLSDIGLGFAAEIGRRPQWRLCAIPFLVQLDGSRHDYASSDLISGAFRNAVYSDDTRPYIPLTEDRRLRSEAWGWWHNDHGLVVIKYNNEDIELSVAEPLVVGDESLLRFGGVGTCLYGEPSGGHLLQPGRDSSLASRCCQWIGATVRHHPIPPESEFTFGTTFYLPVEGHIDKASLCYRDFLDARGHCYPADYDPPVNWNELYDIGWYHSDAEKLSRNYTKERLLKEAEKARDCGCELLYLDPGWEQAEGTTLWDEERLGAVSDLIAVLKKEYGLQLGFRTILRCYQDHWEQRHMVQHSGKSKEPIEWYGQRLWELCLNDQSFWQQKLERISSITKHGARFLMVDEMDWRGPCHDSEHGHSVPTAAVDHVRAVYALCRELRRRCPELIIECHDPVWPWQTSIYVPSYFQQGFGERGAYYENWGFEYMWDCIQDLKSGKALALYYYNLGCSIPLYLHITMAADNDACLFFWWAASTVRHLGIGGKYGHETVNPSGLPPHDPEKRFAAYQQQMALYRRLKPYFVRGVFHGLQENVHLHTLPNRSGGVVVMFNLTDAEQTIKTRIPYELLQANAPLSIEGALGSDEVGAFTVTAEVPAMSPAVVCIGEAVGAF